MELSDYIDQWFEMPAAFHKSDQHISDYSYLTALAVKKIWKFRFSSHLLAKEEEEELL